MEMAAGGTHTYDSPLLPPARHRCGKAALSASPPGASVVPLFPARTPAAGKALPPQRAAGLAAGSCLLGFAGAEMATVEKGTAYGWSRRGVPGSASSFAWPLRLAAARKQCLLSRC